MFFISLHYMEVNKAIIIIPRQRDILSEHAVGQYSLVKVTFIISHTVLANWVS